MNEPERSRWRWPFRVVWNDGRAYLCTNEPATHASIVARLPDVRAFVVAARAAVAPTRASLEELVFLACAGYSVVAGLLLAGWFPDEARLWGWLSVVGLAGSVLVGLRVRERWV